jgi:Na+/H+ antiporter NhaD/arsenite permease-like protein
VFSCFCAPIESIDHEPDSPSEAFAIHPSVFAIVVSLALVDPSLLFAAQASGSLQVSAWSALPFAMLLACIALLPIIRGRWWHSNRNKAAVAIGFALPVAVYMMTIDSKTQGESTHQLLHEMGEYASFIILLLSLYTISGGIFLSGDIPGRPRNNSLFLGLGAALANVIGTTGASMVLIRPVLRMNHARENKKHLPIFFIFIVSNTGGLLTPLGDPPLFLGFLQGVDFFWTLRLWPQWLLVNGALLSIFYLYDAAAYRKEAGKALAHDVAVRHSLRLRGLGINGPLLFGVLLAVLLSSPAIGQKAGKPLALGDITLQQPWGEAAMLGLTALSLLLTPKSVRRCNEFTWAPIVEVAVLFAGIFVAMTPALALLRERGAGVGINEPWQFFWLTGLLSSLLDNAPTYLTFAALAAGNHDLGWLSANRPAVLGAISCGAVFMGALTYIGNGPNFMVKAIADEHGYQMPSFVAYMTYSLVFLVPLFILVTVVFFL